MKNLVVLSILVLMSTKLLSQDITFFFQNLPDEALFFMSKENRKKIVESDTIIELFDMTFSFEYEGLLYKFELEDDRGIFFCSGANTTISINYWDISNGNKLIVTSRSGGPPYNTELDFYQYDGKDYKLLDWLDVMPDVNLISNFFKKNFEQNKGRMLNDMQLLPGEYFHKEGMNLVLSWGYKNDKETLEKYGIIGNKMELIWSDGKFTPGKVYWSE